VAVPFVGGPRSVVAVPFAGGPRSIVARAVCWRATLRRGRAVYSRICLSVSCAAVGRAGPARRAVAAWFTTKSTKDTKGALHRWSVRRCAGVLRRAPLVNIFGYKRNDTTRCWQGYSVFSCLESRRRRQTILFVVCWRATRRRGRAGCSRGRWAVGRKAGRMDGWKVGWMAA